MTRMRANKDITELVTNTIIDILKSHVGRHNAISKLELQEELNKRVGSTYSGKVGQAMSYRVTSIIRDMCGVVVLSTRKGFFMPESLEDFDLYLNIMKKHVEGMNRRIETVERQRVAFEDALRKRCKDKDDTRIARTARKAFKRHSVALRAKMR